MVSPDKAKTSPDASPDCIWTQAGVVPRKFCKIDYNCPECRFDMAMRQVAIENRLLRREGRVPWGKKGEIVLWTEKLKALPPGRRPCIHHMKRRIEFRTCTNEYRCGNCDFDQYFHDQYSVHAVVNPVDVLNVKGFKVPQGYYFHKGHTWVKIEGRSSVRVGIDDFALRLVGPLDSISSPLIGKTVRQGSPDILARREGRSAKLLSPVTGIVTAVNHRLTEEGSLANRDPYADGWVMMIEPEGLRRDLKELMINRETSGFMETQVEKLYQVIEEEAGPLATDGGYLGNDIFGSLPQLGWERLTETFLHP